MFRKTLHANKAYNKISSTMSRRSRQLSEDSFYVGEGSVNLFSGRKTASPAGSSRGHKEYLESLGSVPKQTSRGTRRVDKRGLEDLYTD